MSIFFLSLFLIFNGEPSPNNNAREKEARVLFQEGIVRYDSADYQGAIDKFTEALGIVIELQGEERVRLILLYNIASAHEKAFKVDHNVTHLRQALTLYQKYLAFTKANGDLGDELDVEARIAHLETQLQVHAQLEKNRNETERPNSPPTAPSELVIDKNWKKPRNLGIGLVVSGGMILIGGVTLATVGSTFENHAQDQVNHLADKGVPADHPAWDEGADFIAGEKKRGNIFMGVGASVAILGATGVGVGAYYFVRSKQLKKSRVSAMPTVTSRFVGVQLSGHF